MTKEEAIAYGKECLKINKFAKDMAIYQFIEMAISALEQEPKTGHWIKIKPYPLQMHDYECSECGHETDDDTEDYCSSCGARMVEPQESEG